MSADDADEAISRLGGPSKIKKLEGRVSGLETKLEEATEKLAASIQLSTVRVGASVQASGVRQWGGDHSVTAFQGGFCRTLGLGDHWCVVEDDRGSVFCLVDSGSYMPTQLAPYMFDASS